MGRGVGSGGGKVGLSSVGRFVAIGGGAVADPAIAGALDGSGDCVRGHSRGAWGHQL